jgi:hypothetical protein
LLTHLCVWQSEEPENGLGQAAPNLAGGLLNAIPQQLNKP